MFIESPRFPEDISYESQGGPTYSTTVTSMASAIEQRNQNWQETLHEYDVSYGARTQDRVQALVSFFHMVRGRLHSFRYKDWTDYKSGDLGAAPTDDDQIITTLDGETSTFQLVKRYNHGSPNEYVRIISKPVSSSVLLSIDGSPLTEGADYTMDYTTGIGTLLNSPLIAGQLKGGYLFDVPVRFDIDRLPVSIITTRLQSAGQIPLVEVRL